MRATRPVRAVNPGMMTAATNSPAPSAIAAAGATKPTRTVAATAVESAPAIGTTARIRASWAPSTSVVKRRSRSPRRNWARPAGASGSRAWTLGCCAARQMSHTDVAVSAKPERPPRIPNTQACSSDRRAPVAADSAARSRSRRPVGFC